MIPVYQTNSLTYNTKVLPIAEEYILGNVIIYFYKKNFLSSILGCW
jgi:hypothetical protein